jgi:hypothetical protein
VTDGFFYRLNQVIYSKEVQKNENGQKNIFIFLDTQHIPYEASKKE